ncbi:MAG TPA: Trm112 family protein, partial [Halothiobacillus sp.]|nr:Trm112 family protein [Halothiobacillus sp.]
LAYPVRDGIPIMLETDARPLSADEVEAWRKSSGGPSSSPSRS